MLRRSPIPLAPPDRAELAVWGTDDNVLSVSEYARGDVDAALAASAHTVHETFQTQRIEHAFLEPESTLAVPTRRRHAARLQRRAGRVGRPRTTSPACSASAPSQVTVELVSNGGAFGGKEDMSNQAQTALGGLALKRPVKCTLSREESLRIHPKRHPIPMEYWVGCDADGTLTALKARGSATRAPTRSVGMKVLERAAGHASGPYHVPAVDVDRSRRAPTTRSCGAFRGFGANQAQFAMEGVLDRLAEQVGISGWEIRKRNVIRPGRSVGPGPDHGRRGRRRRALPRRGEADVRRSACCRQGRRPRLGLKNSGLGNGFREECPAPSCASASDDAVSRSATAGRRWARASTPWRCRSAPRSSELDPDRVRRHRRHDRQLGFGQTTGSRGTLDGGRLGAEGACDGHADGRRGRVVDYHGEHLVDWTPELGDPATRRRRSTRAFGYAAQFAVVDRGRARSSVSSPSTTSARPSTRMLCEGQIEGSVHMGLGTR